MPHALMILAVSSLSLPLLPSLSQPQSLLHGTGPEPAGCTCILQWICASKLQARQFLIADYLVHCCPILAAAQIQ